MAVNCAIFYAPWATVLYAGDNNWWQHYGPKIRWYRGQRVSRARRDKSITQWRGKGWLRTGANSGHQAIQYAVDSGAKRIALIGFDQQKTSGRAHCHADHPERATTGFNMGNAGGIRHWPKAMSATARDLVGMGVEVLNLTRVTALTCFERTTPEEFLETKCR